MENKVKLAYRSPRERGGADSYYHREFNPHFYSDVFGLIEKEFMTEAEIAEYTIGWNINEAEGIFKEWN